jgi:hypothetical protein
MLAKFDENSYIDVDSVTCVSGTYADENEKNWRTDVVVGGQGIGILGQPGKNVLEAFLWKHRNSIYDMIHGSETYKKTIK